MKRNLNVTVGIQMSQSAPPSKIKPEVYIPLVINKICRMLYTQFYLVSAFVCRQQLRYFPAKMCFQVDSTTIKLKYFFRVAGKKYFHSSLVRIRQIVGKVCRNLVSAPGALAPSALVSQQLINKLSVVLVWPDDDWWLFPEFGLAGDWTNIHKTRVF